MPRPWLCCARPPPGPPHRNEKGLHFISRSPPSPPFTFVALTPSPSSLQIDEADAALAAYDGDADALTERMCVAVMTVENGVGVRGCERSLRLSHHFSRSPCPAPLSPFSSSALHNALLALKADAHRPALTVDVPLDLVAAVDAGTHPDAFTAAVFARAHRGNQLAAGKAAALGALSGELLASARAAFPAAAAEYEALSTTAPAPATGKE